MSAPKSYRRYLLAVPILTAGLVLIRICQILIAFNSPVSAYLVLGGTPNREIYAAKLAKIHPDIKVLVSGGSENPCIWLIFDKEKTSKENVWMERCSQNTFENFYYSTPILSHWHVGKVLLITDLPQANRALPMAKIILGAKGMWVDLCLTPNSGGEQSRIPLAVDIAISSAWAIVSQVFEPPCASLTHLPDVDMKYWYQHGFYCAPQAQVDDYRPTPP
jgi:hypothetical protein